MEKEISTIKTLVIYIPVVHKGYLQLLDKLKPHIKDIFIISKDLVTELSSHEPDIAWLEPEYVKLLLDLVGFKNIKILNKENLSLLAGKDLVLIQDEISRTLKEKYFTNNDVQWESAFLRWDRKKVLSENNLNVATVKSITDQKFMQLAYEEATKSSDWWRQVGALLVKDNNVLLKAYNKGMPHDHEPYQKGAIRDYLKVGEKPELSTTIHAEQLIITTAASNGIQTNGTILYVTHFPCPVCAKLIATAGIKECYFGEGSASADGELVLKSYKVKLYKVDL